ncbi:alpha/beta hydrolase [Mitsuaria sp. GD03876]|uniref:alpha/beta hydrolase n=1 Tax=Mitsuaria sp. GD03876 TaxID=2975399 RepID=UPI002448CC5C|nr:alpha/beta hydrolase [Mitsuaria sp. GD03876]MDH0863927.1 alpha/beta hydrolase [Mitsuaria sp. GD03876]
MLVAGQADAITPRQVAGPVAVVPDGRFEVEAPSGRGSIPIRVSRDWSTPQPDVEHAVVVIHGWSRRSLDEGEAAAAKAGEAAEHTIVVAPQFLIEADTRAHGLPDAMLRWGVEDWKAGRPALGPAPVSAFDAVDAIVARLADRRLFPRLSTIVIAGHSAGGQLVQRYAAVGHAEARAGDGIKVRYVVANPSSYLYFGTARPKAQGSGGGRCAAVDRWPYGMAGRVPPYVRMTEALAEAVYVGQDITYLLGTADSDPNHPELDRSCAAEAQGATRLERGRAYVAALRAREGSPIAQRLVEVPGVGHNGRAMFTSEAGVKVLFGRP